MGERLPSPRARTTFPLSWVKPARRPDEGEQLSVSLLHSPSLLCCVHLSLGLACSERSTTRSPTRCARTLTPALLGDARAPLFYSSRPKSEPPSSSRCSELLRMAAKGKVDSDELGDDSKPSLQETINARLVQSGEKERLRALLRERLVECGWRDELKARCRTIIKTKGINNVTGAPRFKRQLDTTTR